MNNISGFIQPSMFAQPSMVGIVQPPMPIISAGGRSDIMTIALVSAIVVVILFIVYRNMSYNRAVTSEEEEDVETFKQREQNVVEPFHIIDGLTQCGWKVVVSQTCPYCIKQKEILNQYFPTFNNFDYTTPMPSVPTWINTKTNDIKQGLQSYDTLLNMAKSNVPLDGLTKCGWEVYMSESCTFCAQQKNLLNKHFPTFVNIRYDKPVKVVPTWYNTKTMATLEGLQNYDQLVRMTRCGPSDDILMKCGWVLYTAPGCTYCIKQKDILNMYFPSFDRIYEDPTRTELIPLWVNTKTNEQRKGLQPLEELLKMGNCKFDLACNWRLFANTKQPKCALQLRILARDFPSFKYIDKPTTNEPQWQNLKTGEITKGLKLYDELVEMAKC